MLPKLYQIYIKRDVLSLAGRQTIRGCINTNDGAVPHFPHLNIIQHGN